jgi:hypothetical protein
VLCIGVGDFTGCVGFLSVGFCLPVVADESLSVCGIELFDVFVAVLSSLGVIVFDVFDETVEVFSLFKVAV